ncbi:MAG: hypothetical protein ACI9WU_001604 [Myxococcota bacterium]|jgi:hypothetical protein
MGLGAAVPVFQPLLQEIGNQLVVGWDFRQEVG